MRTRLKTINDSPLFVLAFVAAAYAVFILVRLSVHAWDVSYFVTAGDGMTNREEAPPGLSVMRGAMGHDGQFYYRLSLDPFTDRVTDYGITLDLPAYRHQRILYPLMVHVLSLGNPAAVPFWMLLINYAGICVIAWSGSKYAQSLGLRAVWGLAFACYPGFVLTLARDFTEILAAALVITALWLVRVNRDRIAPGFATMAVLARETTALAAASVAGVAMWRSWKTKRLDSGLLFVVPVLAGIAWQMYLCSNWGHFATSGTGTMGWPFVSFVKSLAGKTEFASGQQIAGSIQMALVAAFAIAAGAAWRSSTAAPHEKAAWVLYATLACIVSGNVWSEDWSFLRNLWELYVFGAVILMTSRSRAKIPFFVCWGALWVFEYLLRMDIHKVL